MSVATAVRYDAGVRRLDRLERVDSDNDLGLSDRPGGCRRPFRVAETAPSYGVTGVTGVTAVTEAAEASEPLDVSAETSDEELGERIVTLVCHLHAGSGEVLRLIAEYDRRRAWRGAGHRSCAHWLAFRTGITLGAARERVRAAHALEELPAIGAALDRGELSFAKVRALTRVAKPDTEEDLLELARATTAAGLERVVRAWRIHDRMDEQELERVRHRSRHLSVVPEGGMYVLRARLDAEVGALLMRGIEAAADALYRKRRSEREAVCAGDAASPTERPQGDPTGPASPRGPDDDVTPEQRRADALGLLVERALAAGFGHDTALSGTRAERYQVVLHVEPGTLEAEGGSAASEPDPATGRDAPMSELEDGTRVSAETSRRLSCDAGVVTITRTGAGSEIAGGPGGTERSGRTTGVCSTVGPGATRYTPDTRDTILDVGRRTRSIPPAIRRALEARDRGCRWPGCGLRFTDAHHVRHWADGGGTRLDNLVLLCRHHHRLVHEEGFRVEVPDWEGGRPNFYDPRGVPLPDAPPPMAPVEGGAASVVRRNGSRGIEPDGFTAIPRYRRLDDVPLEVLGPAIEAIASS